MSSIYFASDFHLGVPNYYSSLEREKLLVSWLHEIQDDCTELFLMGDVFDFWFDYNTVVPKGFVRLLGTLAQLSDNGVQIHIFTGNHDLWMNDYLVKELNAKIYFEPIEMEYNNKKFYLAHGDGLGPGDYGYKFIKKIFTNPICKFLFKWLHPDVGIGLANYFSQSSRAQNADADGIFNGVDKEFLIQHSMSILKDKHYDYCIYGHRHFPLTLQIQNSKHINLGDWIKYFTFGRFDGEKFELFQYDKAQNAAPLPIVDVDGFIQSSGSWSGFKKSS